MLKCIIEEKDPPVTAQSGPWEKITTQADMQALAEASGAIDKGQPLRRKLNVFFEDSKSEYRIFTEEEWDFLMGAMGRKTVWNDVCTSCSKWWMD